MSWLAILLALASIGGAPASTTKPVKRHCKSSSAKQHCKTTKPNKGKSKKKPVARAKKPSPQATPTPRGGENPPATVPNKRTEPAATPTPTATLAPGATATPTPSASPTATPTYPRRTAVDLLEWDIRSSYLTLGSGRVTFNVNNLGEDDHNLAVRGGGHEYGKLDLAPGENGPLAVDLTAGSYTLYCSLLGHEAAGMRLQISVR